MAGKVTVSSLESNRDAIADKLEFIDIQIKSNGVKINLDAASSDIYILELSHWKGELDSIHKQIRGLAPTDIDDHKAEYFTLLDTIRSLQHQLRSIKATFPATPIITSSSGSQAMKLPKLELQPFHGEYLDWTRFKDTFEAAVHNNTHLGKVEKFSYLQSLIKGEASRQCANLALTDANYDIAWAQLHDRYQNPYKISEAILEQLFSYPTSNGTPKSIKGLLDAANRCMRSMEQIGLPMTNSTEVFYIHILSSKLDSVANDLWRHTLKDKSVPKLKEMCEFLECHAVALEDTIKSSKPPQRRVQDHHVTVHHNQETLHKGKCPLGCSHNHTVYSCKKLQAATVSERYELVKGLKLCFNCLKSGHRTNDCTSTWKCKKCSKSHNTLLHRDFNTADEATKTFHTAQKKPEAQGSSN